MTEIRPLVSILTPVFNANKSGYLQKCLDSVLEQDYDRIEHVFADGGSTDGTLEILEQYRVQYPDRIKFISEPDNGVGSALKKAYAHSSGELIGWIDADDYYEKTAVSSAVQYFCNYEELNFIYGSCAIVDDDGEPIGDFVVREWNKKIFLNEQHYIIFCAAFFRREVVQRVGFVNDLGNDIYFYMNVAKKFSLYKVGEKFTNWRLHSQSISLNPSAREQSIRRQRAKEDFFLVIRHGGSIFSPRAMTYLAVLEPELANFFRPVLGFTYPFLNRIVFQIKTSIAMVHRTESGSYARPLFKRIWKNIFRKGVS